MSTYCIGDVQGCYRELQELLDLIGPNPTSDSLWFVGDLVNRGPDSLAVLRFVKELPNKIVVLGNHDFHLLALYYDVIHGIKHNLTDILTANDRSDLIDWLKSQPLIHYDAQHNYILAHAGIYPLWDVFQAQQYAAEISTILQSPDCKYLLKHIYGNQPTIWHDDLQGWARWRFIINCFTRMRFCDTTGHLNFSCKNKIGYQPLGYMPWFQVPQRKTQNNKIIFGHWAALEGKVDEPNIIALDTGCVWGGSLTAIRLEDNKKFQVKSTIQP